MRRLLDTLVGQARAVENARTACTELSRRRVERDEVELWLADREASVARPSAGAAAVAAY